MKLIFGSFEHTRPGFPKVKLKIHKEGFDTVSVYITIKDIIYNGPAFVWRGHDCKDIRSLEMRDEERTAYFDEWVGKEFSEDASVQG